MRTPAARGVLDAIDELLMISGVRIARRGSRSSAGSARRAPTPLPWYYGRMAIAYSRLTAQGQISVPKEVRRKLGIGPGAVLEWEEEGERIVVRRAGRYTSEDLHRALFEKEPEPRTLEELKRGISRHVKSRHARR